MRLAIDTSFKEVSVALASGEFKAKYAPMKQSEVLSELLASLINTANISLDSINEILLSAGPGSFTGLRVSYAWAKGFAITQKCSIVQVSYFDEVLSKGSFVMESGKDRFQVYQKSTNYSPIFLNSEELISANLSNVISPHTDLIPINASPLGIISKLLFDGKVLKRAVTPQEISDLSPEYGHKAPFLTIEQRKSAKSN